MPKEEWGTKRVCPTTGKRFYDMNRSPIVSPYTGDTIEIDTGNKSRTMIADKADPASKPEADTEEVVLEDDDETVDVDLGDDVLEDDEEDNVSLDDITDMAAEGDDDS